MVQEIGNAIFEKLSPHLLSFSILFFIGFATIMYLHYIVHSIREIEAWSEKHPLSSLIYISIPCLLVWAQTVEELAFRGILVAAFQEVSLVAGIAIISTSTIFATMHVIPRFCPLIYLIPKPLRKNYWIDKQGLTGKAFRFLTASILGLITGYLAITYQTILASSFFHFFWNIAMPLLLFIAALIFICIESATQARRQRNARKTTATLDRILERHNLFVETHRSPSRRGARSNLLSLEEQNPTEPHQPL